MLKKIITPKLSINTTNIKKFCYSSEKTYVLILTTFIFFIILGLGKVMHGKIVILAICCYVLCKLISLCKNKLYGGMFLIFSIIICNIPAFLIQISSKREAFNHMPDYLKQSLYFFGTVTLTFIGANVLSTSQQVQTRMEQASIQNLYCSTSFIPPNRAYMLYSQLGYGQSPFGL